tara:strand:+ start:11 stop:613 length:603 start_codon:yes stop_codon:yes gene_type:complete
MINASCVKLVNCLLLLANKIEWIMARKPTHSTSPDAIEFEDAPSKSERKRQVEALQKLGTELVDLTDTQLNSIPMDDELRDAVLLARKIKNKHEGYRRQLQFIGKLMRQRDVAPIEQAMERLNSFHQQTVNKFHAVEQQRDLLLSGSEEALTDFFNRYPDADIQRVRQWLRQASKQAEENKPPTAARQLFVYLRGLMTEA